MEGESEGVGVAPPRLHQEIPKAPAHAIRRGPEPLGAFAIFAHSAFFALVYIFSEAARLRCDRWACPMSVRVPPQGWPGQLKNDSRGADFIVFMQPIYDGFTHVIPKAGQTPLR